MRSFIPNAAMIHTRSFGETAKGDCSYFSSADPIVLVEDELVKISAFLLSPNSSSLNLEETPNSFASLGNTKSRTSSLKPGDIAVIYACELPEIKGKFDPSKAASLGLRPGPKYRELQLGSSVKSDTQDIMVNILQFYFLFLLQYLFFFWYAAISLCFSVSSSWLNLVFSMHLFYLILLYFFVI